uniref:Uncharacterized protein n=1 Tax=Globodera pallida TaxID=36090 RepID=A0A183CID4_GLOPA
MGNVAERVVELEEEQNVDQQQQQAPTLLLVFVPNLWAERVVSELQRAGVQVHAGVPADEVIRALQKPALIILDDLLYTIDEQYLAELFTKKSHHQNFGVIFVSQDLFHRKLKVVRQNSMYIVLLRAPNSALAIRNLGVQLFPRQLDFFMDAYRQATREKYSYLFIDLHPTSEPTLRLRTNIFKGDDNAPQVIFLPNAGF